MNRVNPNSGLMTVSDSSYRALADLVLVLHFAFVAFVVLGLLLIWIGYFARWKFVRNFTFRLLHLLAIGFVAAEAVVGMVCPLTSLEAGLRLRAGEAPQEGSFIQHWVGRALFMDFPETVFTVIYLLFFGLVLASLWLIKPERHRGK